MEYTILKTLYHPEMKTAGIGKMVPAVYFNVLAKHKKTEFLQNRSDRQLKPPSSFLNSEVSTVNVG